MSRSSYTELDGSQEENWKLIRWRGAVNSATKGKRGQQFLRELLTALDAMPDKKLITNELESSGEFCTLGVIGASREIDMSNIDPEDSKKVAATFDIARALVEEIVYLNDEIGDQCVNGFWKTETPEQRWRRMREWVRSWITKPASHMY